MQKILIVDDETRIVEVMENFLRRMGFEIIKAMGGEEAIKVLHSDTTPDLMVVDMKMPKITGVDVIKEMHELNKKIPAIILTGSIDVAEFLRDLSALGFTEDDILTKPIDLFMLLEMVKKKLLQET